MQLNTLKMQVNAGHLATFWQFPKKRLSRAVARLTAFSASRNRYLLLELIEPVEHYDQLFVGPDFFGRADHDETIATGIGVVPGAPVAPTASF